jgi:transposase
MVVLASAGGNDVAAIARLVQTSPDRVREMIHRFNDLGMRSLDPQWAGGRHRQITTTDRALIVKTATTRRCGTAERPTHPASGRGTY